MINKRERGRRIEQEAGKYLVKQGFQLIDANIQVGRWGEIDLIVQNSFSHLLVFVEVRTIKNLDSQYFDGVLSATKIYHLRRSINLWLAINTDQQEFGYNKQNYRCDLLVYVQQTREFVWLKGII